MTNKWNTNKNIIIISRVGAPGTISIYKENTYVEHRAFTLIKKSDTNNIYNYYTLKQYQDILKEMGSGSVQQCINRDSIISLKFKIPKNKQLIKDMEPQFQELEQLYIDVDNADKKYKQLINDLRNESIKQ